VAEFSRFIRLGSVWKPFAIRLCDMILTKLEATFRNGCGALWPPAAVS
jgi:hypothetical protein